MLLNKSALQASTPNPINYQAIPYITRKQRKKSEALFTNALLQKSFGEYGQNTWDFTRNKRRYSVGEMAFNKRHRATYSNIDTCMPLLNIKGRNSFKCNFKFIAPSKQNTCKKLIHIIHLDFPFSSKFSKGKKEDIA